MQAQLFIDFIDRDGQVSQSRLTLDVEASITITGLTFLADFWIEKYLSISDARVKSYFFSIYNEGASSPQKLPSGSVYRRGILIFLAENDELATIEVPAIKAVLMDTTGDRAGIRILQQKSTVNTLLTTYLATGGTLADKAQRIVAPNGFIVGGRTS